MLRKKQVKTVLAIITIVLSIFGIVLSDSSSKFSSPFKTSEESIDSEQVIIEGELEGIFVSQGPTLDEGRTLNQLNQTEEENDIAPERHEIVKVVDGDTLDVSIEGKTERLRLIGIDTPETVDPRKSVQCFGKEASNRAKELLEGEFVSLESDETQGERDKYKRLLRYVFLPDGTNFNLYMITEGYAHEYTYDEPYKYQADFKQAEIDARAQNKGLWSPTTCSGNK